jgi:hypothetical protein
MEAISKTELARRLKISKPRVSQLVRAGMPVLPDGKVDAAVALDWIARRTDPSHNVGRGKRGPAGPVAAPGSHPAAIPDCATPFRTVTAARISRHIYGDWCCPV